ncbi:hypothetical protein [Sedimenticola selenatireducens]|uniref:Crp/Fnr family transcriptional regulator n=1 Tax=Sedimenticola selenatireducens TaxID=191960 RepID=A0A2N6CS08_9GAMM|nr:hypothetical protein [Sedimenticola selenatireducens]PLX59873.1 MAG: hypothetical protein C0630_18370 [Sedimenticola selenatireducens]
MLLPRQKLSDEKRKLLKLYSALNEQDKLSLLAFAEFLLQRAGPVSEADELGPVPEPKPIPRPEVESVVAAIKRLSESYHMLERSALLTETSSLMTAHIMHGRGASEVIDELETLFERHHQEFLSKRREQ